MISLKFNLAASLSKKVASNPIKAQADLFWFLESNYKLYHLLATSEDFKVENSQMEWKIISKIFVLCWSTFLWHFISSEAFHSAPSWDYLFLSFFCFRHWTVTSKKKQLPKLIKLLVWLLTAPSDEMLIEMLMKNRPLMEFRDSLSSSNRRSLHRRFMRSVNSHQREKEDNWVIA